MSIFVLLTVVWIAFAISNIVDAFPPLGWVRLPHWAFWGGVILLIAWCLDDDGSPVD